MPNIKNIDNMPSSSSIGSFYFFDLAILLTLFYYFKLPSLVRSTLKRVGLFQSPNMFQIKALCLNYF